MVEIFYMILLIRRIARSLGIQFFLHILYSEEAVHGVQGQKGLVPYLQKEKGKRDRLVYNSSYTHCTQKPYMGFKSKKD
jgi:hypothetical protein